jgi:hypothetical protein
MFKRIEKSTGSRFRKIAVGEKEMKKKSVWVEKKEV